ncbi:MAG: PAS domain S-box protein [Rhodospirillaceae bacterium]
MTILRPIDARVATALVVMAMAVLFGWQMFAVRQTVLVEAGEQAMALARTAELQVIGGLRSTGMLVADLEALLTGHDVGETALRPVLRARLAAYPDLISLALVDPAGREAQAVAGLHGAAGGGEVIVTARPLTGADGNRLGTAVIGVAAAPLVEILSALPLGEGGRAWLTQENGRILAAAPRQAGAGSLPLLPGRRAAQLVWLADAAEGGAERLVAVRPVAGDPLMIAVGMSVDTILASWRQNLVLYGLAVLALGVVALVYAWLLQYQSRNTALARAEKERLAAAAAARQHGILDATVDGLITLDDGSGVQGFNRSAERIFGYQEAEVLGWPAADLIPGLTGGGIASRCGEVRELEALHRSGRPIPIELVVTEIPADASGDQRLYIGTVRDLSERRAAEAALRESQERNAAILAAAAEGIIAVDAHGRMETVNAAAGRIFGYPVAAMVGRNVSMLLPAPVQAAHGQAISACVGSRDHSSLGQRREVTAVRRDGGEFPLEIAISLLERPEGPLFIAAVADITERKEADAALRSAKLDAEAANQAKTQFLAHMSHELRTPLNAIIGFSDMMRHEMMGPLSPVYLDYARNINESGRQLIGIIDDLLDVSRLQLGKFSLCDGVVDLHSAVAGALAMMRPRAEDSGILLSEGVSEALPKLRGDARAIRQVLINLVSNAVKFTPRGGSVRVSAESAPDGRLLLAVTDTGLGIPPDLIGRVLDPFHHADAFRANKSRGIGLGLPICRWLMELHGGSLIVESTPPLGTTVTAGFPKERVLVPAALN